MSTTKLLSTTLLPIVLAALASGAIAEDGSKVEVRKIRKCEGEGCDEGRKIMIHREVCDHADCVEGGHKVIFIGEDGETTELDGDGNHWVGAAGLHDVVHLAHAGIDGTYLGVGLSELTPELRTHFGAPASAGVMVSKVLDDSPAAVAGIAVGDVITAVNGEPIGSGGALGHKIRSREAGDSVSLEIFRDGQLQTVSATLDKREGMAMMPGVRMMKVRCMDGDDCEIEVGDDGVDFDCGSEECRVQVECDGGSCTCTVNGEQRDCSEIPGVHTLPG